MVVASRIEHYNRLRRQSSFGNQAPLVSVRTLLREGNASLC
jgi:hypothetical protein